MQVIIYTSATCAWCVKLKEWLRRKRVSFEERNITESETYRDEILAKTSQLGVPVIDIDGQMIIGFHEDKLEQAILKGKEDKSEQVLNKGKGKEK